MQLFNQWLNKCKEINILVISTKTLVGSFHYNIYLRKFHLQILSYALVLLFGFQLNDAHVDDYKLHAALSPPKYIVHS
jgi:hypothetical protein